jgi:peptide/nickel transport system ATP-binding protein
VSFERSGTHVQALRGVALELRAGEIFGLVGESGSGKSVLGLTLLGLAPPTAKLQGDVRVAGVNIRTADHNDLRMLRAKSLGAIFQDPMTSLNPVYSVGWQIAEAIRAHNDISKSQAMERAVGLLRMVGIPNPEERVTGYPHEFSGGMRQRVVIAIAMANDPDVILADEPTTALDVTVQAQVLEALRTALSETHAALLLITHDLGVVAGLADRVLVMYAGRPVETGTVDEIFYSPAMPYTIGLLGSLPRLDAEGDERLRPIPGAPPSMVGDRQGCPFAPRCPLRQPICDAEEPELRVVASADTSADRPHMAACHFADKVVSGEMPPEFQATSLDVELDPVV